MANDEQFSADQIAELVPIPMWRCEVTGERSFFNPAWHTFTGRSFDQECGRGWLEHVHDDDVDRFNESFLDACHDRQPFDVELRLRCADGSYRWIADRGQPAFASTGRFLGYVGCSVDITETRRARRRLKLNQRWYHELVEGTDNIVMKLDGDGLLTFINSPCEEIFGTAPDDCVGYPYLDFVHEDDRERTRKQVLGCRSAYSGFENRQLGQQGQIRDMSWTLNPHYDRHGRLLSVTCIGRDLTERKRWDRIHKIQSQVLDSMTEGVVLSNPQGFILYTNPAFDNMFGSDPGALVGRHLEMLGGVPSDGDRQQIISAIDHGRSWSGEVEHQHADGGRFRTLVKINAVEIDGVTHWVSVLQALP